MAQLTNLQQIKRLVCKSDTIVHSLIMRNPEACNYVTEASLKFLASISTLLDVFSQLATCQPAPGYLKSTPALKDARQATETSHEKSRLKRSGQ